MPVPVPVREPTGSARGACDMLGSVVGTLRGAVSYLGPHSQQLGQQFSFLLEEHLGC